MEAHRGRRRDREMERRERRSSGDIKTEEMLSQNRGDAGVLRRTHQGITELQEPLPLVAATTFSSSVGMGASNDKASNIESIENIFVDLKLRKKMDNFEWDTDAFIRERNSSLDDESMQLSWKSFEGTVMHIDEGSTVDASSQERGQPIIQDYSREEKEASVVVSGNNKEL